MHAQEVRDYYKALIVESLDRYDIDGLELDFMREPYLFSAGKETEGAADPDRVDARDPQADG